MIFVIEARVAESTIHVEMTLRPKLYLVALCHFYLAGAMEVCSIFLIGDLNNEGPLGYGQHVLLDGDFILPQLINVSMYMLHEVISSATGDNLGIIIQNKTTIRTMAEVKTTIYEQLRGTTCSIKHIPSRIQGHLSTL